MTTPLLILYSSKTGNAQAIAERLQSEAAGHGFESQMHEMNKWKKLANNFESYPLVVCVASTTGDGELPENGSRFLRYLKKKTNASDMLAGMKYALLALGDTNYAKFCGGGQAVNRGLKDCGAQPIVEIGLCDEAMGSQGMEEVIEPWITGLWPALKQPCAVAAPTSTSVRVFSGGELAGDIAEQIVSKGTKAGLDMELVAMDQFKKHAEGLSSDKPALWVCVVQTVENDEPAESAGRMLRFFKRKTNEANMLAGKVSFTTLGVGDSNLLLDRQTTTAEDCNAAAKQMHQAMEKLGGSVMYPLGLGDERSGLTEVEPWLQGLIPALVAKSSGAAEYDVPVEATEPAEVIFSAKEAAPTPVGTDENPFLVLYGSETGTAKAIAERIHAEAGERSVKSLLHSLDEAMTELPKPLKEYTLACIVCSTTGKGDPPANAAQFSKFLDTEREGGLAGLKFCTLALGDRNYVKSFCGTGKRVDERVAELGAERLLDIELCDDAVEMPEEEDDDDDDIDTDEEDRREDERKQLKIDMQQKARDAVVGPWLEKLWAASAPFLASP
jgi:sulfite reductase alpha subunit-like flavoprotein